MKTVLKDYQKKGVRKIEHFNGRALLADEMGLGKTFQALQWLKNHPEIKIAIVVCPAHLKWVWQAEARKHVDIKSVILSGQKPPKVRIKSNPRLIIINYNILQYWLKYLIALKPQLLIPDEGHFIKSRKAKRTKAIKELSKKIPYVIVISGTPLTNRPSELWTTLNLIKPKEFSSFFSYAFRYCKPTRTPWGWNYKGSSNLAELHKKLKSTMMIRRLKKDVLKELPDKIRQVVPLEIEDRKEYQSAVDNFIKWLKKKSATKAQRAKKAQQLVKLGYLKRLAAELKMKAVLDWIDSFLEESNEKIVIYAIHKKIITAIHDKYKKISVVLDGSTSPRKRKLAITTFQKNKKVRMFIGNIKAAGTGITLTAASTLAFVEIDWTPHSQVEDRIHRITQKNICMIYYLVAKGTIEEKLCLILQEKQEVIAQTLDGNIETNKLDIFTELEKSLKKQRSKK